jgi:hypothetical protein
LNRGPVVLRTTLVTTLCHRLYRDAAVNVALMSLAAVLAYAAL